MADNYTYVIGWAWPLNKWYYGVRTANKVDPSLDLWRIYKTSSDYVKAFVKKHGDPDIIRVDRRFPDTETGKKYAREYETYVLQAMNVVHDDKWLNKTDKPGPPSKVGRKMTERNKRILVDISSKPIVINGRSFKTQSEAAKYLGISPPALIKDRKLGKLKKVKDGQYKYMPQDWRAIPLVIDGIVFHSQVAAARHYNIHKSTISLWKRKGKLKHMYGNEYTVVNNDDKDSLAK